LCLWACDFWLSKVVTGPSAILLLFAPAYCIGGQCCSRLHLLLRAFTLLPYAKIAKSAALGDNDYPLVSPGVTYSPWSPGQPLGPVTGEPMACTRD